MLTLIAAVAPLAGAQALPPPPPEAPEAPVDPDAELHTLVEQLYGRELPPGSVCVDRPTLGEPFAGDPVSLGVQRGARGCVLVGVAIAGALHAPEEALAVAIPGEAWAALPSDARIAALERWTDSVLLAFDQPVGEAAVTGAGSGRWVLTRPTLRRADGAGQSEEVALTLTWDAERRLVDRKEVVRARWLTTMYVRPDKLAGVPEAAVDRALTDHGKVVRQCFTAAWAEDLTLTGRVRLQWTVSGGKAGTVSVITEPAGAERPTDEDLARCYARAVRSGAYPADVAGTVTWVFGIDRRPVAGP